MKLPRWTVWPAFAVLAAFLVPAIPITGSKREPAGGTGRADAAAPEHAYPASTKHPRIVVLGIDGLDPELLQETIAKFPGGTRHFQALIARGGLHSLGTTTPPQSPVAWSSFITGLDPGGHGIFDFIHRDPVTRAALVSTTITEEPRALAVPFTDHELPLGGDPRSNRSGKAFWTLLAEHGVPADIWRMPANFPVESAQGWSFSGMMTPALDSAYGVSKLYTNDPSLQSKLAADRVVAIREYEDGVVTTELVGPENPFEKLGAHGERPRAKAAMRLLVDRTAERAGQRVGALVVEVGERPLVLAPGEWSAFTRVKFSMLPHGVADVWGEVRFYLRKLDPTIQLYCSPVNIDPVAPIAPISAPKSASAKVAEAVGAFYTQGMPEDVNALKERMLSDAEFMEQAGLVHTEGDRMLGYALDRFLAQEDGGFLFFYFSGVDLCSHMMWRHADAGHPHHDGKLAAQSSEKWSGRAGSTWNDVIHDLHLQMDAVLGEVTARLPDDALLVVMSDHGFAPYYRKFSLNTWLLENGYLVLAAGEEKEKPRDDPDYHQVNIQVAHDGSSAVDWSKTRAYGMGFNGLYLNLAGREGTEHGEARGAPGCVQPGADADALLAELKAKLEALVDPKNGARVVLRCDRARDVYSGARVGEAPDLLVGYASGYDNSDPSSLGRVPREVFEDNLGGTFNGSHLMAPEVVPGILLTNGVVRAGDHRLEDLTVEILRRYGIAPQPGMKGHAVLE